jgi:hypothetical protein
MFVYEILPVSVPCADGLPGNMYPQSNLAEIDPANE